MHFKTKLLVQINASWNMWYTQLPRHIFCVVLQRGHCFISLLLSQVWHDTPWTAGLSVYPQPDNAQRQDGQLIVSCVCAILRGTSHHKLKYYTAVSTERFEGHNGPCTGNRGFSLSHCHSADVIAVLCFSTKHFRRNVSRPALRSTQPPVQWVPGVHSRE
jgi:hypothetical protein